MSQPCSNCGAVGTVEYVVDAGGDVCTECGTIFANSSSGFESLGRSEELGLEGGRSYVRQGEQMYHNKGKRVMGVSQGDVYQEQKEGELDRFYKNLLVHVNLQAMGPRVKHLFNITKAKKNFKWGARANAVAAACVFVVCRERQNDWFAFEDLEHLTEISHTTLKKAHTDVKRANSLPSHDLLEPVVYVQRLIDHFKELLASSPNPPLSGNKERDHWHCDTLKFLRSLKLDEVRPLAVEVINFGAEVSLAAGRRAGFVAAAAVLVAMEGVARQIAYSGGDILAEMASSLGLTLSDTPQERYREYMRLLTTSAPDVNWLKDTEITKNVVAQNLEAIVRLRSSVLAKKPASWRKMESRENPPHTPSPLIPREASLSPLNESNVSVASAFYHDSSLAPPSPPTGQSSVKSLKRPMEFMRPPPTQIKKIRMIEAAASDLFAPFMASSQSSSSKSGPDELTSSPHSPSLERSPTSTTSIDTAEILARLAKGGSMKRTAHAPETVRAREQLLAGYSPAAILKGGLPDGDEPTRLRRLLWIRKDESEITDDELFAEGELETFIRSPAEVAQISRTAKYQDMLQCVVREPRTIKKRSPSVDGGDFPVSRKKTKVDENMRARMAKMFGDDGIVDDDTEGELDIELGFLAASDQDVDVPSEEEEEAEVQEEHEEHEEEGEEEY